MNDSERAKEIVRRLRYNSDRSRTEHIRAVADLAGVQEGHKQWEKEEKRVGGLGGHNPYNLKHVQLHVERTKAAMNESEEILNYAVDVFLGKI